MTLDLALGILRVVMPLLALAFMALSIWLYRQRRVDDATYWMAWAVFVQIGGLK